MAASAAGVAAVGLRGAERHHAELALDRRVQAARTAVTVDLRRYEGAVDDLSAALAARRDLTDRSFEVITSRLTQDRLPGVGAVFFVGPDGTIRDGALVEGPGEADAGKAPDSPIVPDQRAVSSSASGEAMAIARESGQVTASRALGSESARVTAVLAGAIPSERSDTADEAFRGWVVMTLRSGTFLTDTLRQISDDVTRVTLSDASDRERPILVAGAPDHEEAGGAARPQHVEVTVAQRTWRLSVVPTGSLVDGAAAYTDEATLWGGLLIAALLGGIAWLLATSRERALARVAHATAALRADIARRETVEARLRERESELAGFIAVTAHDLKTPLTNVSAYADLLAEVASEDLDPTCLGFLERISTGTRRMARLINDLLDFATADNAPLRLEPVDLGGLFADVVGEHTTHLGDGRPNVDVGPLPTVRGDPVALRRLLDNLISNAIKYVRHGDTAQISVGARREPDGWRVEVADRGIGIPPDQRQQVFTAFHRDRAAEGYPGTGLGLAICKRIVDRHGGHIGVEENPGGGSRFWFTLPAASPRDTTAPEGVARGGTEACRAPSPGNASVGGREAVT